MAIFNSYVKLPEGIYNQHEGICNQHEVWGMVYLFYDGWDL